MLRVIELNNIVLWNKTIRSFKNIDFYFFNSYQPRNELECESKLLLFTDNEFEIALPLIIRNIPNSRYFDATSVYGYAGPLRSHNFFPDIIINNFRTDLISYFNHEKIVSVFSRLHPLFNQKELLKGLGDVVSLGQTISINLSLSIQDQKKQYRKGVKSDLSKLRKRGFKVYEDVNKKQIDDFILIYNENMNRVNADDSYFFPRPYYENLLNSKDIDARLFFVRDGNDLIASSIFIFTGKIIQYHLSGTKSGHTSNSPVRLLIDYVREMGANLGYENFHLGGGIGSTEDSLFNFKAGFSKNRNMFRIWKYIVNQDVYDELNHVNGVENDDYFPLYRSKRRLL